MRIKLRMKILIVGVLPPPVGGISIHVKRLKEFLENKNSTVIVCSPKDLKRALLGIDVKFLSIFVKNILNSEIVHFHEIDVNLFIVLGIIKLLGRKSVLTLHNDRIYSEYKLLKKYKKMLFHLYLKSFSKIIYVNKDTKQDLLRLGINSNKVKYIPGFIFPSSISTKIPRKITDFISKSSFVICANGDMRLYKGVSLYGIDLLVKLIYCLTKYGINVKLLFAMTNHPYLQNQKFTYYMNIKKFILKKNLEDKILFFSAKNIEFGALLEHSKLMIRPTISDGYSISLAEAIYFNVPTIASDVCYRTKGTILFKNRNFLDLYNKTLQVIENYDIFKSKVEKIYLTDFSNDLYELYLNCLS